MRARPREMLAPPRALVERMSRRDDTTKVIEHPAGRREPQPRPRLALALLWSRTEPARAGEVLLPAPTTGTGMQSFGRGPRSPVQALELVRQRPGRNERTGLPTSPSLSREQWHLRGGYDQLHIENVGRCPLLHNGVAIAAATVRAGDLIEIAGEMLFLAVERPAELPAMPLPAALVPAFAAADEFGMVGESAAAWELRRNLAFCAGRDDHVLLTGPSGTGKELAAHAIHALSRRGSARLVARNAATFPDGIIDAELFGNARDYPNPGMPERPGLIGAADGSTLFLDEIGELSHGLQAHLLRVLEGGDYHRLGETRTRRADLRVITATNRAAQALKHDVLARLRLRVQIPPLAERREDIPLLARHLLRTMAAGDPVIAARAFPDGDVTAEPLWTPALLGRLVRADYRTHVRELHAQLWARLAGGSLDADDPPAAAASAPPSEDPGVAPDDIEADAIVRALDACGGSRDQAWRALGLRSRHQLFRLMRRHGIGGRDGHAGARAETERPDERDGAFGP
jgi:DNA-binding NtrC family response regulator